MIYFCSQKNRRSLVLQSPRLNGIDYLEVVGPAGCGKQLELTLLKDARPLNLSPNNITITGGSAVTVASVTGASDDSPLVVTLWLNATGDFSTYTLSLVAGEGIIDPPDGFDPQLSSVTFSFKAGCPTPSDCRVENCCPQPRSPAPDINYLAKDYEGFRQLMLDRLATLSPASMESHAADIGMAMVETLAYAADHLSYQQDSVSTEAYIGTARSRISLRRHARLMDYRVAEGSNARCWVAITAGRDDVLLPEGTLFYVRVPGLPSAAKAGDAVAQQLSKTAHPVFRSMRDTTIYLEQNSIDFYTWGDANCCLPAGSTGATLFGSLSSLQAGGVLIFEEVLGPLTADAPDANPANRCAVLLTGVRTVDYLGRVLVDPLNGQAITEITWAEADALPFPLCLSSTTDAEHGSIPVFGVSVARGNIVPADHGVWIDNESLGEVPVAPPSPVTTGGCNCSADASAETARPRFNPSLASAPLTFSAAFSGMTSAAAFLVQDEAQIAPQIALTSDDGLAWTPQRDLLSSDGTDHVFLAEIEHDGTVFLRFGDGQYGAAPDTGVTFTATYRIGNGAIGNIGRDSLAHAVLPGDFMPPLQSVAAVRNPLAAAGGVDAEEMAHIVQYAPFSYQSQMRCVTESDYGEMAAQIAGVREARGTLRWTGSWYTAFVSVDATNMLTPQLINGTKQSLNLLRMMGTDLEVEGAVVVGLRIRMEICVDPAHFQGDVYEALLEVFVTGNRCSGASGLLNASNFFFGETVYASPLIAAAQAVDGVLAATLLVFSRMGDEGGDGVSQGYLTMGPLEVPRCDNDPNRMDHGLFELQMDGGR
ncbi:baseplate J/gp47 family protein [Silvibacterium acidisoli]|uniref:baseplate J/gp47 family protein n=1 Tax=Acidobacteriaceae bacterium ZG23-2 TaxID=2883246 RepID=UPI00406D0BC5